MKVVAISDMHGMLPEIPACDLLLIAGDICPATDHSIGFQEVWLETAFRYWLKDQKEKTKKIVGVAGNHDFIFQNAPHRVPKNLPWTYLQDSGTEFEHEGKVWNIWGSPWQPYFFDWAFNLYEDGLAEKWKLIPDNTDILVLHGPPKGYGDKAPRMGGKGFERTGSLSLLKKIEEVKPKLAVFGHIHEGYGIYEHNGSQLANVSIVNSKYKPVHEVLSFEL